MSRFVQQTVIADPFVLEVIGREEPHAGPGQIRVRVAAAGLNPVDWKIAAYPAAAERFGVRVPAGFGNDYAGTVDEVGDGVTAFAVGDRVFGGARGRAVADHVIATVGVDEIVRTPDGVTDVVAGALSIAGRTAAAALATARVGAGDTVLIGGAAGGVGVLAVQLAKDAGATVIGTASEANHEFLRQLGVVPTAYGAGLVDRVRALAPGGVDAAIDLQGTDTVLAAVELGVASDRIATIAAGPNPPGGAVATGGADAAPDALAEVAAAIADRRVVLPIQATYPIERIDDAVAVLREGHVRGKLVITL